MRLSIVAALYRSAPHLPEFHRRATAVARAYAGDDYEFVFVNDGSPDDSLAVAMALQAGDPRVRVVDLSRNFGHHPAMWTGLCHARGDEVFLIDCDLQEAPEWLPDFAAKCRETGADVVYGVQEARNGSFASRWGGAAFYKVFNALSDTPIPPNLMTVRLMSRRYLEALKTYPEVTPVLGCLFAAAGFHQEPLLRGKAPPRTSTYTFARRLKLFLDAITGFSVKPLVFGFYAGAAILAVSLAIGLGLVVGELFDGRFLAGWPSLMVSVWVLGGLILFCQGIQGLYLAKIFVEAKRRPVSVVRQVHESQGTADDRVRPAA